ncbi:proline dehydrogenase [Spongiactinospora rosea]|uniref:Proline dehydrogenase n=1 Tax=Spongiactinospora rosea TaxID=2248750 RepID=A0A366M814_9ACTN|nr:proline dehydrogenase family protein [Spongiactinospora rosea]RBQ21689.1 proline dehydrogenase [Spongiactinospora rosea]
MLRQVLAALARSGRAEAAATSFPPSVRAARRQIAGDTPDDAVRVARDLRAAGLAVGFDHLGPEVADARGAEAEVRAQLALIDRLAGAGLAAGADIVLRPSALGLGLPGRDADRRATGNAARVCAAAFGAGATVTLGAEEHALVEPALALLEELRKEYPGVGATVQSYLRRAQDQCRALAGEGSRVRLRRGGHDAPASVAFKRPREIDASYVRCLKVLMAGQGHPVVAVRDRCLIDIASALAVVNERRPDGFEFEMRHGVRPAEQRRMARLGAVVRVRVPYGPNWYPYLARALAESAGGRWRVGRGAR